MRFPWSKRENRAQSSTGYTDLLLSALVANAKGTQEGDGAAVAAAEVAAGLWGRCFSGAAVQPTGERRRGTLPGHPRNARPGDCPPR